MIRSAAGFGPKLAILIYPVDPDTLSPDRQATLEGARDAGAAGPHTSGLGLHRPAPEHEVEGAMARTAGTSARTQRLIAVAATCLLGAVTAFAIGRVFQGHAATYRLLAAALASALLACALERRNLLAATAVSAAALLVAIGILIFPATTWHGLPTVDTLHAIGRAAALVGQQARVQVAPSLPLAPLMLAALTATWAAVFSSHALAFRAGSPLLALLPPVALVAFADTVLDQFVKPALRRGVPRRGVAGHLRGRAPTPPGVGPGVDRTGP